MNKKTIINTNKNKWWQYRALFFVIFCSFFIFYGQKAKASILVDQEQSIQTNWLYYYAGWNKVGQKFIPTKNNIVKISWTDFSNSGLDGQTFNISICQGEPDWLSGGGDKTFVEAHLMNCSMGSDNILVYSGQRTAHLIPYTADVYVDLPIPYFIDPGLPYYFGIDLNPVSGSTKAEPGYKASGVSGIIINGSSSYSATSITYKTWYNTDYTVSTSSATSSSSSEYTFYNQGGYTIPMFINCYTINDYCDMVFGYDLGVFSRSITSSTSADLPNYPRFWWWWPNQSGTAIVSSTIRTFIDYGFTDNYVKFTFPKPTSSTDYVLELKDPLNSSISTSTAFVVHANLIGTSTYDMATCLGSCDSGIVGEIFCGLKSFTCWIFSPSQQSYLFLKQSSEKLTVKFPFSVVFDITNAFKTGLTITSDNRSAGFSIPFIRATSTGSEYYMLEILNASSTEKVIGKTNATLLRNSIVWFCYIMASLGVLTLLIKKK